MKPGPVGKPPKRFAVREIAGLAARKEAPGAATPGKRHRCNLRAADRAWQTIGSHPELHWLAGKVGILAELGRVADVQVRLDLARQLCELQPSVRRGVGIVRRHRLGLRRGSPRGLADSIRQTVDEYLAMHPMSRPDVLEALRSVLEGVDRKADGR